MRCPNPPQSSNDAEVRIDEANNDRVLDDQASEIEQADEPILTGVRLSRTIQELPEQQSTAGVAEIQDGNPLRQGTWLVSSYSMVCSLNPTTKVSPGRDCRRFGD